MIPMCSFSLEHWINVHCFQKGIMPRLYIFLMGATASAMYSATECTRSCGLHLIHTFSPYLCNDLLWILLSSSVKEEDDINETHVIA